MYNQDIPADDVNLESNEDVWDEYIYLPRRLFKGHGSVRYKEWWKSEPVPNQDLRVPLPPKMKCRRSMKD